MVPCREMIFTGPIDEYFDYRFGKLPYRSLEFRHETLDQEQVLPVAVVNYPNDHAYTRITEFKHSPGRSTPRRSIVYEYPRAEGDPYYPIPSPECTALYNQYKDAGRRHARRPLRRAAGDLQVLQHGPGRRPGAGDLRQAQRRARRARSSSRTEPA